MRKSYFIIIAILYLSACQPKEQELIPEISAKQFASPEEVHSYVQNKISDPETSHMLTMDVLFLFNKEYKQIVGRKRDFFTYFFQIFEDVQYISANYTENKHIQIPLAKGMYHFDSYSIIRKVLILREGKSQAAIHEFYIVMNPYTWTIHNISHHSPEFYELNRDDNMHLNLIE